MYRKKLPFAGGVRVSSASRRELTDLESQRDALDTRTPPAKGSFFRYTLKEMRQSLGQDPAVQADLLA